MTDQVALASVVIADRQRTIVEVDDDFIRSVTKRLINPIALRRVPAECSKTCEISDCPYIHTDQIRLIAGGRRLEGLRRGGLETLIQNTHFRWFEDLSEVEAQEIEFEENIKRADLPWRDHIRTFGRLVELLTKSYENWTPEKTAERLNVSRPTVSRWSMLYKNLTSPLIRDATSMDQAFSILQLHAERRAAEIVSNIHNIGRTVHAQTIEPSNNSSGPNPSTSSFDTSTLELGPGENSHLDGQYPSPQNEHFPLQTQPRTVDHPVPQTPSPQQRLVLTTDFLTWAPRYSGPKFNVIHVDFPYGIDFEAFNEKGKIDSKANNEYVNSEQLYWDLLGCFTTHIEKFCSYSAHVMFWFSMDFYERTRLALESCGFSVNKHPLHWFKSDNLGIMPGAQTRLYPRRLTEAAFLCTRSARTLVKASGDTYAAPHASSPLHKSHKPESMLKHFFSMLVDETSDFLDPTCGSGSALRAADELGARTILGLEIDPRYSDIANQTTLTARNLRHLSNSTKGK